MVHSAGFLIFNMEDDELRFLLVHPGGPYWRNKLDQGWGIPKGKIEEGEEIWDAAVRETYEELGNHPELLSQTMFHLGSVKQSSKKTVHCIAIHGDFNHKLDSMKVRMEWPKGSGEEVEFPEIDAVEWFTPAEAKPIMIHKQYEFVERLIKELAVWSQQR